MERYPYRRPKRKNGSGVRSIDSRPFIPQPPLEPKYVPPINAETQDRLIKSALRGKTVTFTPEDPTPEHSRGVSFQGGSSRINGRRPTSVELGSSPTFLDRVRWKSKERS